MNTNAFRAYFLEGGHAKVDGWVVPGALTALHILMGAQEELDVSGHVGEIGVHHGRYFLAMAALSRPSERLVAVDIFEDQHLNVDQSGRGDREHFLENVATHGPADADQRLSVIKADSTAMSPEELRAAAGGPCRFFSVDGGHTVRHVINDVALAEATLCEGGIISVDDFFNADWPGIAEGLVRYAAERTTSLVPLFYGDNKLYLVQERWAEAYWLMTQRELEARAAHVKHTEFLGHRSAHIRFRPPEADLATGKVSRIALWHGRLVDPGSHAAVRFETGWSLPVSDAGRWTIGDEALATVTAPELRQGKPARLHLHCYAFTGRAHTRAISIVMNGQTTTEVTLRAEETMVTLNLPAGVALPVELRFRHEPVGSPIGNGQGADDRDLGILVTKLELEAAPNAIAGSDAA